MDSSSLATMKYKEMMVSPNAKNIKIMKKKKEALKKNKENFANSKMMRSGSVSTMFQNHSITDSATKNKSLTRQKTSGVLKTIP